MDNEFPNSEAKAIAALAWSSTAPEPMPAGPAYVTVPDGASIESLEARGLAPWRPRAAVAVADVASFVEYVTRHGTDQTVIFANDARIGAVLNFRGASTPADGDDGGPGHPGTAGHGDDLVAMRFKASPEWLAWENVDSKRLTHTAFAEWIEDHVDEIVEPAGARLLEIATALNIRRDAEFRSAVRLQSGAQSFAYTENDTRGDVELPSVIALGIPPFEGSPAYRLEVRIRYRLEAGKLALWFARVRPDLVLRAERLERLRLVREALPGVPVFLGAVQLVGVNCSAKAIEGF